MSDSDIEIKKVPPIKPAKNEPRSPMEYILKNHEKKVSTKIMIHEALKQLKTRKGVSSYAIKKFLEEKYNVETDKVKYLIKKTLKRGVEDGSIIQMKGIGASGSFKLAAVKGKTKKEPTLKKETSKEKLVKEKTVKDKPKKAKPEKTEKVKEKVKKVKIDSKDKEKVKKNEKSEKPAKSKVGKEKKGKIKEVKEKTKGIKASATPAKKRANMMKRKSIGSIIKPPKMKPKSK